MKWSPALPIGMAFEGEEGGELDAGGRGQWSKRLGEERVVLQKTDGFKMAAGCPRRCSREEYVGYFEKR